MNALSSDPEASSATLATTIFRVNGKVVETHAPARTTLLDWLRESAGLTGIKKGCNEGACGTCTVLMDEKRMNGCLVLLAQCDGCELTTVDGLTQDARCIRFSGRSFATTPFNAATARPASSCPPWLACRRGTQVRKRRSASG